MHPFVKRLVEHHSGVDSPAGQVGRELRYWPGLPVTGDLRTYYERNGGEAK